MTGGAGEDGGGGDPDDTYLRLDGGNNPASPNNFLRTSDADGLYLSLGGGTLTGNLTLAAGVDILGSTSTQILAQDFQFTNVEGAIKDSSGALRITIKASVIEVESTSFLEGSYVSGYDPSPPLYGGGDTFWYQQRNIRFKDTAGPPDNSEGVDGDVTLNYQF